ncbi:MAG: NAD(P)-binding protein, partial [Clostridiales Family XIII bacterium]|nr:NAD(P)-binding protein [Clostridiales Family XIII bacterium]
MATSGFAGDGKGSAVGELDPYLEKFNHCLQKEPPFCRAECPFHLDVPEFIDRMRKGMYNAAFKTYRNAVGFPRIAAALCHEPCKGVCPAGKTGGAIEMRLLEQACLSFAKDKGATGYNIPSKKKKVAVIGGGISGLACALRLSAKKYDVELFTRGNRIGGALWGRMEPDVFLRDIEEQFRHEKYTLHLNAGIKERGEINDRGFAAVYAATGQGGADFGLPGAVSAKGGKHCLMDGDAAWFAGGSLVGREGVYALADGLHMGTVLDNYLKTGNLLYPENKQETRMVLDPARTSVRLAVKPGDGAAYTEAEAGEEAGRCLKCQCDACRLYCDLTEFTDKWPLRIRDEVVATTLPGVSEVKATPAKRLMSASNLAGVCKEVCPAGIDLEGLLLAGRQSMHRQEKAPWVFHDFWLRDMDFANGAAAALCKIPAGHSGCAYAFFPGCQLGAGDARLVEKTYGRLLQIRPDTGLLLRCCGAPAEWAGDAARHEATWAEIREDWGKLGKPTLLAACPSCMEAFKRHMPAIPMRSLYEALLEWGAGAKVGAGAAGAGQAAGGEAVGVGQTAGRETAAAGQAGQANPREAAVFDPCAARREPGMKDAVRALAAGAGYALQALREQERAGRCCGYGGQPAVASPEFAGFVAQKRVSESELPYIVYCVNCRDAFRKAGKKSAHILELIFEPDEALKSAENRRAPTVTERRWNRTAMKQKLLQKHWGETMD